MSDVMCTVSLSRAQRAALHGLSARMDGYLRLAQPTLDGPVVVTDGARTWVITPAGTTHRIASDPASRPSADADVMEVRR